MSRRLLWCLLGAALVAGAVGGIVASRMGRPAEAADPPGYAKQIDVQKLRLVGEDGKVRAALAVMDGSVILMMSNPTGEGVLELSVNEKGNPCLLLHDRSGTNRLGVALMDGYPTIELGGPVGKSRCEIAVGPDDLAAIRLLDASGSRKATAALLADKKGSAWLVFIDKAGKVRWSAP